MSLFGRKKSHRSQKTSGHSSSMRKYASKHLALEPLERRELLSVATWTGSASVYWNNPLNWSREGQSQVPQNGDDVVLSGTTRTSTNNNLPNLSLNSIRFSSNDFSISGSGISLNNTTQTDAIIVDAGVTGSAIGVGITLNAAVTANVSSEVLSISGALSGSNSLRKIGSGTLALINLNTSYTGVATVGAGTLKLGYGSSNGSLNGNRVCTNIYSAMMTRSTSAIPPD
jgi:hypothetical protein